MKSRQRDREELESEESDDDSEEDDNDARDPSVGAQSRPTSTPGKGREEDPGYAALLEEAEESLEEDSGDGEESSKKPPLPASKSSERNRRNSNSPLATICILVCSCWTLRLPVIYMDFVKYAVSFIEQLFYHVHFCY